MKLTKSLFILIIFLFTLNAEIFEGLTLITDKGFDSPPPFLSLLIDNDYNIINEWYHDCRATSIAYLMPDSSLILPCSNRLKRIDWDGNIIWDYYINDDEYINHHDIEPLTNGNILVICWELKTKEEAIAAGRQNINGVMSTLVILELRPLGENDAQIIWKWHAWDHLIQDIDSLLPNFGIISENPQLIDINLVENLHNNGDWLHTNSIHYSPVLDQIILSSRFLDEFFVIDHSTSIEEASGHFGGNSEKGGDLLFRWGNPKNYGRGDEFDQILFSQHSVNWIPNGYPGAGNIILFNNHHNNVIEPYHSSVIELVPPIDSDGIYILNENEDFDPESFSWIFLLDYVAGSQSGAFKLPNGNILYSTYINNQITEIDTQGQILWEYNYNDHYGGGENQVARALKYSYDYFDGVYPCLLGDLNGDGGWDVLDIIAIANCVLVDSCSEINYSCAADTNGDGEYNILDIITLANCVLADSCGS